jgi:hypothetical protein
MRDNHETKENGVVYAAAGCRCWPRLSSWQISNERSGIITEAPASMEISTEGEQEPAGEVQKLDQVIALLGTISGQLGAQAKPASAVKAERTAPAPQREAPQGVAVQNGDPRFVTISGDADGLIVSMTEQRASLEDIVAALNAAGYRTATGQEGPAAAAVITGIN